MARLPVTEVEQLMAGRPGESLESVLGVFEVFASGSLVDEVYVLDDVGGKRLGQPNRGHTVVSAANDA